jgi:hypothetical protein
MYSPSGIIQVQATLSGNHMKPFILSLLVAGDANLQRNKILSLAVKQGYHPACYWHKTP